MRNLFYIVVCILISIIIGLLSPLISPELFNLVKSNDNKELEYVEIVEVEAEKEIEKDETTMSLGAQFAKEWNKLGSDIKKQQHILKKKNESSKKA